MRNEMRRCHLTVTPELFRSIMAVLDGRARNPAIENWLRRVPEIDQARRGLGLQWRPRPPVGSPGVYVEDELGGATLEQGVNDANRIRRPSERSCGQGEQGS